MYPCPSAVGRRARLAKTASEKEIFIFDFKFLTLFNFVRSNLYSQKSCFVLVCFFFSFGMLYIAAGPRQLVDSILITRVRLRSLQSKYCLWNPASSLRLGIQASASLYCGKDWFRFFGIFRSKGDISLKRNEGNVIGFK